MTHPDTNRAVLFYLSTGQSTQEILAQNPELSQEDIQEAASVALRILEAGETREDRITRVRRTYPHAFKPWTQREDRDLLTEWRNGASIAALARAWGRPAGTIRIRLEKLGVDLSERVREKAANAQRT